jgi:hypothetical protein
MNIPLDRLYHYIENIAEEIYGDRVIIYRFWPHGSKNIQDLSVLHNGNWFDGTILPLIWCHDQEPLNHGFYKKCADNLPRDPFNDPPINLNLRRNIFEKNFLLHSEKRSKNLEKHHLDKELISIYYWSHALIARDWFRYAEHETFEKGVKKTFLIYNRAWSGTREYRLRFSDLLIKRGLVDKCQSSCNAIDPDLNLHYSNHTFVNPQWQPIHILENFLHPTTADSTSSADFNTNDYNLTDIEVVLETLFDDDRLHLTEKTLRPIACGQPFILGATQGSLEYLRSYGFQTFGNLWNESYDQIANPGERLIAIIDLMQQIAGWDTKTRTDKMAQAISIANYNRRWFFSKEFFDLTVNELKTNLKLAFEELDQCNNYQPWIDRWTPRMLNPEIINFLNNSHEHYTPNIDSVNQVMLIAQNKLAEVANKNKT